MSIICNKWRLDGSQKNFHENVAEVPGQLQACLAYTGRAYEQSVLVCAIYKLLSCKLPSTLYNVQITKYTVQCTNYQVHCTMYKLPSTLHVQCTNYQIHCTMYKLPSTLYNVQITKYTVQCTNYQLHSTIYNVQVHVKIAKKCFYRVLSIYNIRLKGVFTKNERGYRLNAIKKRF